MIHIMSNALIEHNIFGYINRRHVFSLEIILPLPILHNQNGSRGFKQECRKEILKKALTHNKKTYAESLPFFQRTAHKIKDNKKKLIFLLLVIGLGSFYGYHRKLYYFLQRIEPASKKFDRWVLGIPNKVPSTVKEQDLREIALQPATQERLLNLYASYDGRLHFGVGRNLLFNIYSRLGLLQKDDEKRSFWVASGYYRERNQKIAGVTPKEFLTIFEEALSKLKKSNRELTEESFLERFVTEFNQELPQEEASQRYWKGIRQVELSKVAPDDSAKQMFVAGLLAEDINMSQKKIEDAVVTKGLQGLAVKDRHHILTVKIMERSIDLHLVRKKLNSSTTSANKMAKYRQRATALQLQLQQLKRDQQQLEQQYRQYYNQDMY